MSRLPSRRPRAARPRNTCFRSSGWAIPGCATASAFPIAPCSTTAVCSLLETFAPLGGLERLLADYFGANVRVHQFIGCWRLLDSSQWTKMGPHGKNQTLGAGALLGKRVWDQAGVILLELGPLHLAQFYRFLPGEPAHAQLAKLARFYVGANYRIQARLLLKRSEVREASLGGARLGYTSWMSKSKHASANGAVNFFLED